MKVAVTASGPDLNSPIDPRFGRAAYFVLVDTETYEFEAVANPYVSAMGGAGIQAAQLVANRGAQAIISGAVGPNAFQTLSAVGLGIYQTMGGTVRQAVDAFKANRLPSISQPGPGHAGMGGGFGMGAGFGRTGGLGRGMGMGRGMGFGGPAYGTPPAQTPGTAPTPPGAPMDKEQEMRNLKQVAEQIARQLEEINRRIEELEKKTGK